MKIFYNEKMVVEIKNHETKSSLKPQLFVQHPEIIKSNIIRSGAINKEDIYLAHDPDYVNDIFEFKKINGFGNLNSNLPPSTLYTIGSLLDASRYAIQNRTITCSPTSGFHHACYDHPEGYCTFNGLIVVAEKLIQEDLVKKVVILDCDMHYGNGTDDIIKKQNLENIFNISLGKNFNQETPADIYQKELVLQIDLIIKTIKPDIVIYQAGAYLFKGDPLGGILNEEELKIRDLTVFEKLGSAGIPVVWNLAGGYMLDYSKTIQLHINTYQIAQTKF